MMTAFWWDIVSSLLVGASIFVGWVWESAFLAVYFILLAIWIQVRSMRRDRG